MMLTPRPEDFAGLATLRTAVLANPATCHIGAAYLTGKGRADFDDVRNENVLGRLGTYIQSALPKSTLASSPHFAPGRIQGYPRRPPRRETDWTNSRRPYLAQCTSSISSKRRRRRQESKKLRIRGKKREKKRKLEKEKSGGKKK